MTRMRVAPGSYDYGLFCKNNSRLFFTLSAMDFILLEVWHKKILNAPKKKKKIQHNGAIMYSVYNCNRNCNNIVVYLLSSLATKQQKDLSILESSCHLFTTRWRFLITNFNAKRQVGKLCSAVATGELGCRAPPPPTTSYAPPFWFTPNLFTEYHVTTKQQTIMEKEI